MAWNSNPHAPPGGGPFGDFLQSMAPDAPPPGYGVDHADQQQPHGFTFGPAGFNGWAGHGFGGPWGGPRRGHHEGGPWGGRGGGHRHGGRGGRHGRCRRNDDTPSSGEEEDLNDITIAAAAAEAEITGRSDPEKAAAGTEDDNATMQDAADDGEHPDPPEEAPPSYPHRQRGGGGGRRGGCGGGRGRLGGGRGHGHHHHSGDESSRGHPHGHPRGPHGHPGPHGHHGPRGGHHGPPPTPPPYGAGFGGGYPFDFNALMGTFANHPSVQHIRTFVETARAQAQGYSGPRGAADNQHNDNTDTSNNDDADSFSPPVDIFDTQNNWTIHVSVPGAKRDDIGVTWDADKSILSISGVVYRPGDEEFLGSLLSGERKVGLFERKIQLPPPAAAGANSASGGEKEEVDGDHITAKMEDGILILVVPKAEKEWTEVKRVDIE